MNGKISAERADTSAFTSERLIFELNLHIRFCYFCWNRIEIENEKDHARKNVECSNSMRGDSCARTCARNGIDNTIRARSFALSHYFTIKRVKRHYIDVACIPKKNIYKFNDTWQILAQNSMFNSNIGCSFFACVSSFVPSFIHSNVFFWLWSIGCCRLFTVCVCE